nr:porin family protein [Caulobacter sp. 17J65-9]
MFVSTAAAALIVVSASAAQAGDTYVQLDTGPIVAGSADATVDGIGTAGTDTKFGFLGGVAYGMDMGNGLAVEGELVAAYNGVDMGVEDPSMTTLLLMANAKYTVQTDMAWKPYVAAGVGYGKVDYDLNGGSIDDYGVAWHLKAGVQHKTEAGKIVEVGYRYTQAPELKATDGFDTLTIETGTHAVTVGVRF